MARLDATDKKTIQKIEKLAETVLKSVKGGQNPFVEIPIRSLANVRFNEKKRLVELGNERQKRYFFNVSMAKKFMQTFLVSDACRELIESGKTTSIRDLYYMTKHTLGETKQNTFEEQEESDPIIEDLEVSIDSLREELHLFATGRGSMVGPLTIRDSGDTIDLRRMGSGGWSVPSIVEEHVVQLGKCEAKYVLLVEKDAVWKRFNEDKYWLREKCIIVTGQGQPPRGVRRLVQRLHSELKLPVYVLVDNDPWGFYIYSVLKQGSINLAYESMRMAVPAARFIGLSSFDKLTYELPSNVAIKMNEKDNERAKQMLAYPWFKAKQWQQEIQEMVKSGVKFELEALSRRGISFITEEYLPRKLKEKDWLE
jgi:DNA topoisomerase-6 subunit A